MHDSKFIAYVGPSDIHDGRIVDVHHCQNEIAVHVKGSTDRSFSLTFSKISEFTAVQPVDMILYALVELSAPAPFRRFVFANWADHGTSRLEIVAENFGVVDRRRVNIAIDGLSPSQDLFKPI